MTQLNSLAVITRRDLSTDNVNDFINTLLTKAQVKDVPVTEVIRTVQSPNPDEVAQVLHGGNILIADMSNLEGGNLSSGSMYELLSALFLDDSDDIEWVEERMKFLINKLVLDLERRQAAMQPHMGFPQQMPWAQPQMGYTGMAHTCPTCQRPLHGGPGFQPNQMFGQHMPFSSPTYQPGLMVDGKIHPAVQQSSGVQTPRPGLGTGNRWETKTMPKEAIDMLFEFKNHIQVTSKHRFPRIVSVERIDSSAYGAGYLTGAYVIHFH